VRFLLSPPVPIADKELHRGRGIADGLKQLGDENNRRRVSQIEATIADFDKTANDLESWIQAEQNRTRIHDPTNPVYSTLARAMTQRRDKLKRSIDVLKRQLADIAPTAA
jgi:septation ring formation regulator EzrA